MQLCYRQFFYYKLPIYEIISIIADNIFLPIIVELENGTQFTVKQCDSKGLADDGEGKYHWFGGEGNGKSIIEFIYEDNCMPSSVAFYGSWGYWNWSGLDLNSNIKSIKKINYGKPIEY